MITKVSPPKRCRCGKETEWVLSNSGRTKVTMPTICQECLIDEGLVVDVPGLLQKYSKLYEHASNICAKSGVKPVCHNNFQFDVFYSKLLKTVALYRPNDIHLGESSYYGQYVYYTYIYDEVQVVLSANMDGEK